MEKFDARRMRRRVTLAVTAMAVGVAACGEESQPRSAGEPMPRTDAPGKVEPLPADRAGGDKAQIRELLAYQHDSFLAGDPEEYCSVHVDEMRTALAGCEFVEKGLAYQRGNGLVVEDLEILELTLEGEKAYVAVYEQKDDDDVFAHTPTDYQLTKAGGVWRISLGRYRTEREDGPAKCFVGGSMADLC